MWLVTPSNKLTVYYLTCQKILAIVDLGWYVLGGGGGWWVVLRLNQVFIFGCNTAKLSTNPYQYDQLETTG